MTEEEKLTLKKRKLEILQQVHALAKKKLEGYSEEKDTQEADGVLSQLDNL